MANPNRHGMVGLALAVAFVASCQAQQPIDPASALRGASMPSDPLTAFRKAWGVPAGLMQPPRAVATLPGAPRFQVSATDSLWGSEVTVQNAAKDQEYPSVAYNTSAKNYLVVWHDWRNTTDGSNLDIYAQLVTNAGATSGTTLTISNAAGLQMGPRVVYNTVNNEYLIAWTDARSGNSDIYTQRVSATGTLPAAATVLASGAGNQTLNSIAYHSSQNQYLVTWTDDASGSSVLNGARLTNANAKTGGDIAISTTAGALANGASVVNAGSGEYVVVWPDARAAAPGIYAQRITSAGALSGSATAIASGAGYEFYSPRLTYNTFSPGFLVSYDRRTTATGEADVLAQRLTTTATANGAAIPVTSAAATQMLSDVACDSSDGNYVVAWSDGRAGAEDLDVYGLVLKSDGTVQQAEYVVSANTSVQAMPALAFDSNRKQFLFVWQDARAYATTGYDVYAQRAADAPLTAIEIMEETLETFNSYAPGTSGGVNGARQQLEEAIKKIVEDNPENAIQHLENFLAKLPNLQSNGSITAEERAILENMANEAIAQVQAGNLQ